jgi:hypothetical protein
MEIRLKKIGKVKATQFNKDFDGVYDYWKKRAEQDYKYYYDLKFEYMLSVSQHLAQR